MAVTVRPAPVVGKDQGELEMGGRRMMRLLCEIKDHSYGERDTYVYVSEIDLAKVECTR